MISPSPQCVGQEFVRQYYTMLHEAPDFMHRFYSHDSSFIHGGPGDGSVHGQSNIHKKILSLNFRDCHARIRQVDSLGTIDNAVVVQVSGELSNDGKPMRRFMQTFVLAPQSPKKYYVHNDIFRYQDEVFVEETLSSDVAISSTSTAGSPECTQVNLRSHSDQNPMDQSVAAKSGDIQSQTNPNPPRVERTDDHKALKNFSPSAPARVGGAPPNGYCKGEGTGARTTSGEARGGRREGHAEVEMKEVEEEAEEEEDCGQTTPTSSRAPQSWAAVMSNKKIQPTDSPGCTEKAKPPKHDKSSPLDTPPSGLPESTPLPRKLDDLNSPVEEMAQVDNAALDRSEGKTLWHSDVVAKQQDSIQLFIGNLPSDISANTLRKIFSKYGEVIDVRINRKVSLNKDVPNFGFVSFDSMETARKILNARPFHLDNGHRLNVEEKKSDQIKFTGGNVSMQHRTRPVTIMQPSGRGWWGGYRPDIRTGVQGHPRAYERYGNGNPGVQGGPKGGMGKPRLD